MFVSIPFDEHVWGKSNSEPLILAIILLSRSRSFWKIKNAKFVSEYERNLQKLLSDNFFPGGVPHFCH